MTDPIQHEVEWYELDKKFSGLATGREHEVLVAREAIPIIFVPGIMGTRLRRAGTRPEFPYPSYNLGGEPRGDDDLPLLRWDPDSTRFMLRHYIGAEPNVRRAMMIGPTKSRHRPDYLEPDDSLPVGNGRQALLTMSYGTIFDALRNRDWGPLQKIFTFPVYGFGYNWTDTCINSGKRLALRIKEVIQEAKQSIGRCQQVVLVTHSMGGLVARSASELNGASGDILGIIHGVQPVNGSAVAYWRIKAGFEITSGWSPGQRAMSSALGNNGRKTTVLLGNMPGGLELLPTTNYPMRWLRVTQGDSDLLVRPRADPYNEIYRERSEYWRLVDESLLDPDRPAQPPSVDPDDPNGLASGIVRAPWDEYLLYLGSAQDFHRKLETKAHGRTYTLHGTGLTTADTIELAVESNWFRSEPYPMRGFRGFFKDANGKDMQAVLQQPSGDGDGTVPVVSATALDSKVQRPPEPMNIDGGGHEPIYQEGAAVEFVFRAVEALCKVKIDGRKD